VVSPRRSTDPTVLKKSLTSGGSLRGKDVALNDTQMLYIGQELADADTLLQAEVDTKANIDDLGILAGFAALAIPDSSGGVYPEQFGAVGDGVANDTTAFQALAAFVQAAGGGTIILRPAAVYLVGRQSLVNDGTYMWKGENILTLAGLTRPFLIRGNGARLKLAAGLKIGTFNAAGAATAPALPYFGNNRSQPVIEGVVDIQNCTAAVALENFEVDGNEANLNWGGQFGDTGWQVGGDGLFLKNNTGGIRLVNVHAHDCPRDSLDVNDGPVPFAKASYQSPSVAIGCRFIRSVRQAMSFVGGGGWSFIGCRFTGTGTGSHASAPIAGIDLEAEGGAIIRDIHFINCTIGDTNTGVAALSVGDVEGVVFDRCRFLGLTSWTTYGWNKAAFNDCFFLGSMVAMTNTKFNRCTLSDDTTKSPTGTVYLGTGYIPDFGGVGTGCVFDECVWDLVGAGRAGLGGVDWTCRNCTIGFGPTAGGPSFMRPRWEGINILGPGGRPSNSLHFIVGEMSGKLDQVLLMLDGRAWTSWRTEWAALGAPGGLEVAGGRRGVSVVVFSSGLSAEAWFGMSGDDDLGKRCSRGSSRSCSAASRPRGGQGPDAPPRDELIRKLCSDSSVTLASIKAGDFGDVAKRVAEEFPFPEGGVVDMTAPRGGA
jgi:hypothetical protein